MKFDLDELEAVATRSVVGLYGPISRLSDVERFWIQKGIEGMRYAVALAQEGEGRCRDCNAVLANDRVASRNPSLCSRCETWYDETLGGCVLVYCKACHKTHAVDPGEEPCAPGAWIVDEPWDPSSPRRTGTSSERGGSIESDNIGHLDQNH